MRTLAEIKRDMIVARNSNDEEWAKELSQEKQRAKKYRPCVDCGLWCRGIRCQMHGIMKRFYEKTLGPIHT